MRSGWRLTARAGVMALMLAAPMAAGAEIEDLAAFGQLARLAQAHPGETGVYVLEKGEESLLARAWLADHAEKRIDVQYFIWSTDNIGTLASEALLRAAERGVTVRVIVDDLLIDAEYETLLSLAAHPNVHIRIYNPKHSVGVSFWRRLGNLVTDFRGSNQRMHDKTALFDGVVGITGGRNMADEYYDYDHAYNFRDRDVLLVGDVVPSTQASFQAFWDNPLSVPLETLLENERNKLGEAQITAYRDWLHRYAADSGNFSPEVRRVLADVDRDFPELIARLHWSPVEFLNDRPGKNVGDQGLGGGGITTAALIEQLNRAERRVTIQSPYLVLPEGGLEFFKSLIDRGVAVRIVTNSLASTDNMQAFSGYHKQREAMLKAGLQIFEYRPHPAVEQELVERYEALRSNDPVFAIHAKTLVIDGETLFIGTFNLDPRSANLNTEVGALIHAPAVAAAVEARIEQDMRPENSWNPARDEPDRSVSWWKRLKLWFWKLWPLDALL